MKTKKEKERDKLFNWIFYMSLKIGSICRKNNWRYFFEVSREKDFENLPEYVPLPSRPGEMVRLSYEKSESHDEGRRAN